MWLKASAGNPRHGSVRGATRPMSDSCNAAMPDRRTRWTSTWSATRVIRRTYEIVAKTSREMRLGRYKPGDVYQDRPHKTSYSISRILRSGQNEFLIYLKPLVQRASAVL